MDAVLNGREQAILINLSANMESQHAQCASCTEGEGENMFERQEGLTNNSGNLTDILGDPPRTRQP
jgi:hypothetical protein